MAAAGKRIRRIDGTGSDRSPTRHGHRGEAFPGADSYYGGASALIAGTGAAPSRKETSVLFEPQAGVFAVDAGRLRAYRLGVTMKNRLLGFFLILLFSGSSALALRPEGWFWNDGDWEWSSEDEFWYWIPPGPPFLENQTTGDVVPRPVEGWLFYDWPYFYALNDATWYFVFQGNLPFVFKPSADPGEQWTLWGSSPTPPPPPDPGPDPEMVEVAGRSFDMMVGDQTVPIEVSDFRISVFEVSGEDWREVYEWAVENGYDFTAGTFCEAEGTGRTHPVTSMSWYDAVKWCNALSEKNGLEPVYYTDSTFGTVYRAGNEDLANDDVRWDANGYRLPTEAEWYLAAIGGKGSAEFPFSGGDDIDSVGWYRDNSPGGDCSWFLGGRAARGVGQKAPNALGLYDMTGNMVEWVWNVLPSDPDALPATMVDPRGPNPGSPQASGSGTYRGGSWNWFADDCEVFDRFGNSPATSSLTVGLRVVRSGLGSGG